MSDWPERVADERVSISRIRGEAVDAPWLEEAAQAHRDLEARNTTGSTVLAIGG